MSRPARHDRQAICEALFHGAETKQVAYDFNVSLPYISKAFTSLGMLKEYVTKEEHILILTMRSDKPATIINP